MEVINISPDFFNLSTIPGANFWGIEYSKSRGHHSDRVHG